MEPAAPNVDLENLVFCSWKEVKHKSEPHGYIEFFLITDTGNEVLAISAEDHGNSHYGYQSTGAFAKYGALRSKNRADTLSWLEMVIKESQAKGGGPLAEEMAHAGQPTPENPLGIYYTQHKVEKAANPDGTHTQRFFLLDQYGSWHLAVLGEERETRDGHYLYSATEGFSARYPLRCHAQKDVIHWLEQRISHHLPQAPMPPAMQPAETPIGPNSSQGTAPAGRGPTIGAVQAPSVAAVANGTGAAGDGTGSSGLDPHPQALHGHTGLAQHSHHHASHPGLQGPLLPPGPSPETGVDGAAAGGSVVLKMEEMQLHLFNSADMSAPGEQAFPAAVWNGLQPPALTPPPPAAAAEPQLPAQPGVVGAGAAPQHLPAPSYTPSSQQGSNQFGPQQQQQPHFMLPSGAASGQAEKASPAPPVPPQLFLPLQHQELQPVQPLSFQGPVQPPAQQLTGQPFTVRQPQPEQQATPNTAGMAGGFGGARYLQAPSFAVQQQREVAAMAMQEAQMQSAASAAAAAAAQQQQQQQAQQFHYQLQFPMQQQQQLQGQQPSLPPLSQGPGQFGGAPSGAGGTQFLAGSGPMQIQMSSGAMQLSSNAPPMQLPGNGSMQLPLPPMPQGQGGAIYHQQQLHQQIQLQPQHAQQLHMQQLQQQQNQLQQLLHGPAGGFGLQHPGQAPPPALQPRQSPLPPLQLPSPHFSSLPPLQGTPGASWLPSYGTPGAMGMAQQQGPGFGAMNGVSGPGMGSVLTHGPYSQLSGAMPGAANAGAAGSSSALPAAQLLPGMDFSSGMWNSDSSMLGSAALGSMPGGFPSQSHLPQLPSGQPSPLPELTGGSGHGRDTATLGFGAGASVAPGPMMPPSIGFTPGGAGGAVSQPFATPSGAAAQPAVRAREGGAGGSHQGGRGGAGGRGSGSKHKLAGVAEVAHKRKLARIAAAGEEAVRAAQGAYLASLRHAALSEAAQQESLRKTIASWVRGQISEDEVSVSGWHDSLEEMLRDADRTRAIAVRFLSNERLLDLARGSAEAAAVAAATSVAGPNDSVLPGSFTVMPGSASPAAAATPPPPPLPAAAATAAEAPAVGMSDESAAATAPQIPSQAEALAAVSSLKALLLEDFDGALLGGIGSLDSGNADASAAAAPPAVPTGTLPDAPPVELAGVSETGSLGVTTDGMNVSAAPASAPASEAGKAASTGMDVRHAGDQRQAAPGPEQQQQQQGQVPDVIMADPAVAGTAAAGGPDAHLPGSLTQATAAGLPVPTAASAMPLTPEADAGRTPYLGAPPVMDVMPCPAPGAPAPESAKPLGPVGAAATVACAGTASSWTFADPHMARHGVRVALESLREVAALCPPIASMATSKLLDTVKQYVSHPHAAVSSLASDILRRWRGTLVHRLRSMSDTRCYQDPVAALEAKIQANEITYPNWNELLGVPRGSASSTDGTAAANATPAPGTGPQPGAVTPLAAAPPASGSVTPAGGMFPFAATPTPPAAHGSPLPSTAATPAFTAPGTSAGRTPALFAGAITAAMGASGLPAAGAGAVGTPRGLFDAAGAGGQASVPTPQLFRPGSSAALQAAAAAAPTPAPAPLFGPASPAAAALRSPSKAAAAAAAPLAPSPLAGSPVAVRPRTVVQSPGGTGAAVAPLPLAPPHLPQAKPPLSQPVEAAVAVALAQATRRLAATLRQGGGSEAPSPAELLQLHALATSTSAYVPLKRQSASQGPFAAASTAAASAAGGAAGAVALNEAVAVAESALQQRICQLQQHGLGVNMRLGGPSATAVPLFVPPASSSAAALPPLSQQQQPWPAALQALPSPAAFAPQSLQIPPLQLPPMQLHPAAPAGQVVAHGSSHQAQQDTAAAPEASGSLPTGLAVAAPGLQPGGQAAAPVARSPIQPVNTPVAGATPSDTAMPDAVDPSGNNAVNGMTVPSASAPGAGANVLAAEAAMAEAIRGAVVPAGAESAAAPSLTAGGDCSAAMQEPAAGSGQADGVSGAAEAPVDSGAGGMSAATGPDGAGMEAAVGHDDATAGGDASEMVLQLGTGNAAEGEGGCDKATQEAQPSGQELPPPQSVVAAVGENGELGGNGEVGGAVGAGGDVEMTAPTAAGADDTAMEMQT